MRRSRLLLQARTLLLVLRRGEWKEILREFTRRAYSNDESYVLRRDLSVPLKHPAPKLPIVVRPIRDEDLAPIVKERPRRFAVLRAKVPTCYVAAAGDGALCYMQWLIDSSHQQSLRPFFKGELRSLKPDEVLLEFAYTFERFRGKGVMAAAMAEIAEKNLGKGSRWALTYVQRDNLASLKGCKNAGFRPYLIREEKWRLFRLEQRFTALPLDARYPWEEPTASVTPPEQPAAAPTAAQPEAGAAAPHL